MENPESAVSRAEKRVSGDTSLFSVLAQQIAAAIDAREVSTAQELVCPFVKKLPTHTTFARALWNEVIDGLEAIGGHKAALEGLMTTARVGTTGNAPTAPAFWARTRFGPQAQLFYAQKPSDALVFMHTLCARMGPADAFLKTSVKTTLFGFAETYAAQITPKEIHIGQGAPEPSRVLCQKKSFAPHWPLPAHPKKRSGCFSVLKKFSPPLVRCFSPEH